MDIRNAESVRTHLRDLARERLRGAPRPSAETVVLDWSAAPFLTMAGVAAVEEFRSLAQEAGVPVKIFTNRAVSRAVLRIVGMDELVPVYDTVDEALSHSNGNSNGNGNGNGNGNSPSPSDGARRSTRADGQSDEPSTA